MEFTYFPGFEKDFKRAVKAHGPFSVISANYNYDRDAQITTLDDEDDVWRKFLDEEDEDDDDIFDTSIDLKLAEQRKVITTLRETHAFYYQITDVKDDDENDCPYDFRVIVLLPSLVKSINKVVSGTVIVENGMCVTRPQDFFCSINDFRKAKAADEAAAPLKSFVDAMESMFQRQYSKMDKQIESNKISHDSLWYHYDHRGQLYEIEFYDHTLVYYHSHFQYSVKMGGAVVLELIGIVKEMNTLLQPVYRRITHQIPHYSKFRSLESFNIRRVTNIDELKEREKRVLAMLETQQQMHFSGTHIVHSGDAVVKIKRDERVVVDNKHREPDLYENILPLKEYTLFESEITDSDNISLDDTNINLTLLPFLPTYNLGVMKSWGLAHIDHLQPVNFNISFDNIVMDESKKSLIRRLVTTYSSKTAVIDDVVDRKNNGLVLLLHGKSGVGKTLTAEIIADITRRPLYKLSCGELTLDTTRAEIILQRVAKLCENWNGVLLLDEADIFLEERGFSPVRDGLVALFLRFIEYCNCIIILTTNRLSKLDSSIQSRLNLLLEYPDLTEERRQQIWLKTLERTNRISKTSLNKVTKKLGKYKLNGRQIYKTTQTALLTAPLDAATKDFVAEIDKIISLTLEYERGRGIEGLYN